MGPRFDLMKVALACLGSPVSEGRTQEILQLLDSIYRAESGRILATLIHLLGDFELAEDAMQDAFIAAAEQWQRDGVPQNPRAYLVSMGRFKAIDSLRRRARFDPFDERTAKQLEAQSGSIGVPEEACIEDERLRLIFTCCHPALAPEGRVALTLREVCGLATEEIARAFLISPATLAQRIVRAKARIRELRIPYEVPSPSELPLRLNTVLQVIYLVFNEGYYASCGVSVTRTDLAVEAIRLGKVLKHLMPEPEVAGLLGLMLLQNSRHTARTSSGGDLILLEDQDRSLWNRDEIVEGLSLVEQALTSRRFGPYTLQAAIAALHSEAPNAAATDWAQIAALYRVLARAAPSPIVDLNRAVAIAMHQGPEAGLLLIDALLARGELADYHLAHAARADLCRRLGKTAEALASYDKALTLTRQEPERRFLQNRMRELKN